MGQEGRFSTMLYVLRNVVLIALVIFAVVGVVCWLAGWRTAYQYGEGLFWAGAAVIVIGVLILMGAWVVTRIPEYQYGQTVGEQRIQEHTRQDTKDTARSHGLFILMATVGMVCIVAGALIQAIAG